MRFAVASVGARNANVNAECSGMSSRMVIVVALLAALLGAGVGGAVVAVAVKEGPPGPQGEAGPAGPRGPEGDTQVAAEDVQAAIDEDPGAVASSLSGHLDYEDIQQNLDPDPADVQSSVDDVQTSVDDLCSQLTLADALANEPLTC
jgi:hypothetical protein